MTLLVSHRILRRIKALITILAEFNKIAYSMNTFQDYFTLIDKDDGVDVVVNFKDKHFDYDSDVKVYQLSVFLTDYAEDPTGGRKLNWTKKHS